jgi:hypothetical protein
MKLGILADIHEQARRRDRTNRRRTTRTRSTSWFAAEAFFSTTASGTRVVFPATGRG